MVGYWFVCASALRSDASLGREKTENEMLRKFLKIFDKENRNPCLDWPMVEIVAPHFHLQSRKFGELEFGDAIEMARVYGRPEFILPVEGGAFHLIYARAGFLFEFSEERLSYVAYFVAEDQFQPNVPFLNFCEPLVDSHLLTASDDAAGIKAVFGSPRSIDHDLERTILFYRIKGLIIEFELGKEGSLRRVNIFPDEEESK